MLRIKLDITDKDEHKLITHLEHVQWAIAGGEKAGPGWELEGENESQDDSKKT
jgi:hypothetical protein